MKQWQPMNLRPHFLGCTPSRNQRRLVSGSAFVCLLVALSVRPVVGCEQPVTGAQPITVKQQDEFPPVPMEQVKRYTIHRTDAPIKIDGKLDEAVWQTVPKSPNFVDLISGQETLHSTKAALLWDDEYLYVAYWIEEPFVTAKFKERDAPIWQDNDVELFIAGADAYYEFEINAHGTIYEGFFIWKEAFESAGYAAMDDFDITSSSVTWQDFNGVGLTNHPRGKRLAFLKWDFPGLRSAVDIQGTLNDDTDVDQGWTVELALPWKSFGVLAKADGRAVPPNPNDQWRMDFSRFNQYKASPSQQADNKPADSGGWAWSYHGVWDSHIPEVFPVMTFSNQPVSTTKDGETP